jgi:hypothetical protein
MRRRYSGAAVQPGTQIGNKVFHRARRRLRAHTLWPSDRVLKVVRVDHTHSPGFVIVSAKDTARRAHEIYVDRGYADGFDREDWLRAEHELTNPPRAERVFPRDARRRVTK